MTWTPAFQRMTTRLRNHIFSGELVGDTSYTFRNILEKKKMLLFPSIPTLDKVL